MFWEKEIGRSILGEVKVCDSWWSQFVGLMFTFRFRRSCIFVFDRPVQNLWHMLFVFYPVDMIFIRDGVVVELKPDFKPFCFHMQMNEANIVIEARKGFIEECGLVVGDVL